MVIEIVDQKEKIEAFLPELDAMVPEGLVTLEPVQVILYRARDGAQHPDPLTRLVKVFTSSANLLVCARAEERCGRDRGAVLARSRDALRIRRRSPSQMKLSGIGFELVGAVAGFTLAGYWLGPATSAPAPGGC